MLNIKTIKNVLVTDENQGVFLENESGLTRLSVYNRRGTNVVDSQVPSELAA